MKTYSHKIQYLHFFISLTILVLCGCKPGNKQKDPVDYVNMFIGTTMRPEDIGKIHPAEYGGVVPAVCTPFGMTKWTAATRVNDISIVSYNYADSTLIGFQATHQPLIWMGDFGFFSFMPQINKLRIKPEERAVKIDHSKEKACPYHYQITYNEPTGYSILTEMTATSRCAKFRITYPEGQKPILFLEAARDLLKNTKSFFASRTRVLKERNDNPGGWIEILPEKNEIRILNSEIQDAHLGPQLKNFGCYYILKFNTSFNAYGTWKEDNVNAQQLSESGADIGGYVEFGNANQVVEIDISSSFVSFQQAEENLGKEISKGIEFEKLVDENREKWNNLLSRASIFGASEDDLAIFYTSFFRTQLFPAEFSEYGKYYSAFDGQIHEGKSYTSYSIWDIFRAQFPWLQMVVPERAGDMITALLQNYKEGGWLPKFPNPTYSNIMIGTHADAMIADAYVNGLQNFDAKIAYEAIRKNAFTPPSNDLKHRWEDRHVWTEDGYEARGGLTNYIKLGYVASDFTDESVSRTLEFALDDYCVAQMANGMGQNDDYNLLINRSRNYRNLYNKDSGFFQARKTDGSWDEGDTGFTEGANWTYLFCVMQDMPGLIKEMGGEENFEKRLDEVFEQNHYVHGNEPGHHYAYSYNFCNQLNKTQVRVTQLLNNYYRNTPDSFVGNEDVGQMSAWYLFSCLGFYPFCPASGQYALGIPLYEKAILNLPNGKVLTIKAQGRKSKDENLLTIKFNGQELKTPFIGIKDLWGGGLLEFLP